MDFVKNSLNFSTIFKNYALNGFFILLENLNIFINVEFPGYVIGIHFECSGKAFKCFLKIQKFVGNFLEIAGFFPNNIFI